MLTIAPSLIFETLKGSKNAGYFFSILNTLPVKTLGFTYLEFLMDKPIFIKKIKS